MGTQVSAIAEPRPAGGVSNTSMMSQSSMMAPLILSSDDLFLMKNSQSSEMKKAGGGGGPAAMSKLNVGNSGFGGGSSPLTPSTPNAHQSGSFCRFRKTIYWGSYEEMMNAYLEACTNEMRVGALHTSFYCNEAYQERVVEAGNSASLGKEDSQRQKLLQRFRSNVEQTVESLFREMMEPRVSASGGGGGGGPKDGGRNASPPRGSAHAARTQAKTGGKGRVYDGVFYWEWSSQQEGQLISNHERRCCQALMDLGIHNLSVPMTTTVNIADICVTAIALTPIEGYQNSQRPGTCVRLHYQQTVPMAMSEEGDSICTELSLILGIGGGNCRSFEVHRGHDGRMYFIGNADWFPCVSVAKILAPMTKQSTFQSINSERHTNIFKPYSICWGTPYIFLRHPSPVPPTQEVVGYETFVATEALPQVIAFLRDHDIGDQVFPYLKTKCISSRHLPVVLEGILGSLSLKTIHAIQNRIFIKSLKEVMLLEFKKAVLQSTFTTTEDLQSNFIKIAQAVVDFIFRIPESASNMPTAAAALNATKVDQKERELSKDAGSPNKDGSPASRSPYHDDDDDARAPSKLGTISSQDPVAVMTEVMLPACSRKYVVPPTLSAKIITMTMGPDMKRRVFQGVCKQCGLQVLRGKIKGFIAYVKKFPVPHSISPDILDQSLVIRANMEKAALRVPIILKRHYDQHLRHVPFNGDCDKVIPVPQSARSSRMVGSGPSSPGISNGDRVAFNNNNGGSGGGMITELALPKGAHKLVSDSDIVALEDCINNTTTYKAYNIHLRRKLGYFWLSIGDYARASSLLRAYAYSAQGLDSRGYKDIEVITHALVTLSRSAPNPDELLESVFVWQPRKWLDPPLFMRRAFFQLDLETLSVAVGPISRDEGRMNTTVALRCLKRAVKTMEGSSASHPDDARLANDIAVEFVNNQKNIIRDEGLHSSLHQLAVQNAEQLLKLAVNHYTQFVGVQHPDTLTPMTSLTLLYVWNEDKEKAITLSRNICGIASSFSEGKKGDSTYGNALLHFSKVLEKFSMFHEACTTMETAVQVLDVTVGRVAAPTLAAQKKLTKLQRRVQQVSSLLVQKFMKMAVARRRAQREVSARRSQLAILHREEQARLEVGKEQAKELVDIIRQMSSVEEGMQRLLARSAPLPLNLVEITLLEVHEGRKRFYLQRLYLWTLRCIVPEVIALQQRSGSGFVHRWMETFARSISPGIGSQHISARSNMFSTGSGDGSSPESTLSSWKKGELFFGMPVPKTRTDSLLPKSQKFVRVKLTKQSTLEQIARRHGSTVHQIRLANPEYNHCFDIHIVPKGVTINLPETATANVGHQFNTIAKLSQTYNVPIWALKKFNSVLNDVPTDDTELGEGIHIYVPSATDIEELMMGAGRGAFDTDSQASCSSVLQVGKSQDSYTLVQLGQAQDGDSTPIHPNGRSRSASNSLSGTPIRQFSPQTSSPIGAGRLSPQNSASVLTRNQSSDIGQMKSSSNSFHTTPSQTQTLAAKPPPIPLPEILMGGSSTPSFSASGSVPVPGQVVKSGDLQAESSPIFTPQPPEANPYNVPLGPAQPATVVVAHCDVLADDDEALGRSHVSEAAASDTGSASHLEPQEPAFDAPHTMEVDGIKKEGTPHREDSSDVDPPGSVGLQADVTAEFVPENFEDDAKSTLVVEPMKSDSNHGNEPVEAEKVSVLAEPEPEPVGDAVPKAPHPPAGNKPETPSRHPTCQKDENDKEQPQHRTVAKKLEEFLCEESVIRDEIEATQQQEVDKLQHEEQDARGNVQTCENERMCQEVESGEVEPTQDKEVQNVVATASVHELFPSPPPPPPTLDFTDILCEESVIRDEIEVASRANFEKLQHEECGTRARVQLRMVERSERSARSQIDREQTTSPLTREVLSMMRSLKVQALEEEARRTIEAESQPFWKQLYHPHELPDLKPKLDEVTRDESIMRIQIEAAERLARGSQFKPSLLRNLLVSHGIVTESSAQFSEYRGSSPSPRPLSSSRIRPTPPAPHSTDHSESGSSAGTPLGSFVSSSSRFGSGVYQPHPPLSRHGNSTARMQPMTPSPAPSPREGTPNMLSPQSKWSLIDTSNIRAMTQAVSNRTGGEALGNVRTGGSFTARAPRSGDTTSTALPPIGKK